MRVLLTGGTGQLGTEIQRLAPDSWEIVAPGRATLELSKADAVRAYAERTQPTHIVHAGAWTAVDAAEAQPDVAHAVNAESTAALAAYAHVTGARMLYVSTDFVFGPGHFAPIPPDAAPAPQSVYGATKLAGERAMQEHVGDRATIVRTSWVYAAHGQNFVRTMLHLMQERDALRVVDDQIGAPTSAQNLARFCIRLLTENHTGTWHFSDAGAASWYDFACAIYEEGRARGLLSHDVTITPIPSEEYPTPATRPHYSLLDKRASWALDGVEAQHWRVALREVLSAL